MTTKRILLCPGQGAQAVGMGKAWYDASAAAREVFAAADDILHDALGEKLSTLCFDGPVETLNKTSVAQPAIYTASVASFAALRDQWGDDVGLQAVAGLSLGEYTALHIAGVFSFADGLRLVEQRGRFMQQACDETDGTMLALIGIEDARAEEIADQARQDGVLTCANFNAPGQVVLSGDRDACKRALDLAEGAGKELTVAGAFHSPFMASASEKMRAALAAVEFHAPAVPVVANVTANPHDPHDPQGNGDAIRRLLVDQITSPVRWSQSCAWLVAHCAGEYHELCPGKVLAGLMRRINRPTKVINHNAP
ncbi:MAG: ACP S-malonyltransferase [Phycisphaerales bacterium]|nr:ACP S-malonyltransferase [Phycisphaerales bacterium]